MIFAIDGHKPDIHPTAFIHPTAEIAGRVRIGPRASVWGGCILRGDIDWIQLDEDCNVQDGSVLHTSQGWPVHLKKGVTVGHAAVIHGSRVDDYSLIGMNATLLDGSVVETHCLVAAGAVVREKGTVPQGMLAAGVPAKIIRALTEAEIAMIVHRASDYVRYSETYRTALREANFL